MADHVASLLRTCPFQLRQLRLVRSSLNEESAKTLVHAFVSSRLDYCNSLLHVRCQRWAAAEVTRHSECCRTSGDGSKEVRPYHPGASRSSLAARQRIRFKLAMIVYKCLHGLAPPYLADDCIPDSVASRRYLRSADTRKMVIRRTRTRTVIGARDFAVSCIVIWNSQPIDLRVSSLSAATFARHLKACLFCRPS